ncbi:hypothetical protein FI667_g15428, partial [Globisporangium splendens]
MRSQVPRSQRLNQRAKPTERPMDSQQRKHSQFSRLPPTVPRIDSPFPTRLSNARLPIPILAASPAAGSRRTRPRAKTNSERGRFFRQRQKEYEDKLARDVERLRAEIAQLSFSKCVWYEKALLRRTSHWGSLTQLSRELYTVLKHGLESIDHLQSNAPFEQRQATEQAIVRVEYKKNFLRRFLHPDVVYGDLVGIDSVIEQWQIHTMAYAHLEIEVGAIEAITGSEENPIVVIRTKVHARISRETFPIMFPFVRRHRREDLMEMVVDRDFTFNCVSRFQFSEDGRVIDYGLEFDLAEALVHMMGDARHVAELTRLSVISPDTTLPAPEAILYEDVSHKVNHTDGSYNVFDDELVHDSKTFPLRVCDCGDWHDHENPNHRHVLHDTTSQSYNIRNEHSHDNGRSHYYLLPNSTNKDEEEEYERIV